MLTAITNARLVLPEGIVPGSLLIEDGIILAVGRMIPPRDAHEINIHGQFVGPGFVDIHCHGGGTAHGYEDPAKAAAHHLAHGTTTLLLSLAYTQPESVWFDGIRRIRAAIGCLPGNLTGIHFEGPYTNPHFGASSHKAWSIDRSVYEALLDAANGLVYQCTYAPEMPGARGFAQAVRSRGITLAVGHTDLSPAVLETALADGVTLVTHLFDAMGCYLGNDSVNQTGIIQDTAADAVLACDDLYYEIICDSRAVHVKPSNLRLAYRLAGPDKLILITDATVQAYSPRDFPSEDKRSSSDLNYNEAGELSGSWLTMDEACRNMAQYTRASLPELFQMAATNPARAISLDDKVGSLESGKEANMIICDESMQIHEVYLRGQAVFDPEKSGSVMPMNQHLLERI